MSRAYDLARLRDFKIRAIVADVLGAVTVEQETVEDGVEWVIATTDAAQADEVIRAAAGVAVCIWRGPPTTLGWREGM